MPAGIPVMPFSPGRIDPYVILNGWNTLQHVGDYENGVTNGHSVPLALDIGSTTLAYGKQKIDTGAVSAWGNGPMAIADGDDSSYCGILLQHTHQYAGLVLGFDSSRVLTGAGLVVISEIPANGWNGYVVGPNRDAGLWTSVDGGTNWSNIYQGTYRAKATDTIALPDNQLLSNVQLLAFTDSHDDMIHLLYSVYVVPSVSPSMLATPFRLLNRNTPPVLQGLAGSGGDKSLTWIV